MAYLIRPNQSSTIKRLPGLVAWWDFSDPATLGPLVSGTPSTVADKSGKNNFLARYSANTSPMAIGKSLTKRTAIDGATGATSLGYSTATPNIQSGEMLISYAAMYPSAVGGGQRVIANGGGGGNWLMGPYSNNWNMFNGSGFIGSPGAFPVGKWAVHTGVVSAARNLTFHYGNGVLQGSASGTGYPGSAGGLGINVGISFGEFPRIFLGEVIVLQYYDDIVRRIVDDYLMRKWGAGSALATGRLLRPSGQRLFFLAGGSSFSFSLADTNASSDALTALLLATASPTDTAASSDSTTGAMLATASPTDTAATSDATTAAAKASQSDSASTSDALTGAGSASASQSDSHATSDSTTGQGQASGSLSDTVATSDVIAGNVVAFASLADSIVTSDALTIITAGVFTFNWSDSLATSDVSTSATLATATQADSVATADAVTGNLLMVIGLADSVSTSDATTGAGKGSAALLDTVLTSDAATSAAAMTAAILDAVASSDALSAGAKASLADFVTSSDSVSGAVSAFLATLSDALATSDHTNGSIVVQFYPVTQVVAVKRIAVVARSSVIPSIIKG